MRFFVCMCGRRKNSNTVAADSEQCPLAISISYVCHHTHLSMKKRLKMLLMGDREGRRAGKMSHTVTEKDNVIARGSTAGKM